MTWLPAFATALALLLSVTTGFAQDAADDAAEIQPYLEKLKEKHGIKSRSWKEQSQPAAEQPYTPPAPVDLDNPDVTQPHLESLREKARARDEEQGRQDLPPEEVQPYLESLRAGHKLKPRIEKTVGFSAGFSISASSSLNVTSGQNQANNFENIYGVSQKWVPAADFFYERQFFRNSIAGSIGPVIHVGVIMTKGKGIFSSTGERSEDTELQFIGIPASFGLSYRFLALRYVAPFVQLGLAAIPFFEQRNDGKDTRRSLSHGYGANFGIAFNIDWFARRQAWDRYGSYGVVNTYIVAQRQIIHGLFGSVDMDYSTTNVGLSFEF